MRIKRSGMKTGKSFWKILPIFLPVLLFAALTIQLIPVVMKSSLFGNSTWLDTLLVATFGSISTAQPVVSDKREG